jgi:hypothetical protein
LAASRVFEDVRLKIYWLGIVIVALLAAGELVLMRMATRASGWDALGAGVRSADGSTRP